eukprot:gnl/TRDRNA2_/TRDRNA2_43036_c0_seq1.p2 gnl/TRDRNA2_/TRDRNA2_43036_c0~~gnl/TRDRNA2_/TRDRNA2_43036_c0_seq1.p2  ORF type:complete len:128 (+),score=13.25 gnl/TRDRNA2_/TRDRNA2_43036_c0_seq1:96-479(+)
MVCCSSWRWHRQQAALLVLAAHAVATGVRGGYVHTADTTSQFGDNIAAFLSNDLESGISQNEHHLSLAARTLATPPLQLNQTVIVPAIYVVLVLIFGCIICFAECLCSSIDSRFEDSTGRHKKKQLL